MSNLNEIDWKGLRDAAILKALAGAVAYERERCLRVVRSEQWDTIAQLESAIAIKEAPRG